MHIAEIESLVKSTLDPALQIEVKSESKNGDTTLTLTSPVSASGRAQVRWIIYRGLEVFSFWFDDLWSCDFDYDVKPDDKAELVLVWVRFTERYFRGDGTLKVRRTRIRRRLVHELALTVGSDTRVLDDRPPLFGRSH